MLPSRYQLVVSQVQDFLHEDFVLNFMSCLSSIVTAVIRRGTDNNIKNEQQARSDSDCGNNITNQ
jgi:Na+-translocating ferredoxin:NAD+ oxidoreductase RnfG subunit